MQRQQPGKWDTAAYYANVGVELSSKAAVATSKFVGNLTEANTPEQQKKLAYAGGIFGIVLVLDLLEGSYLGLALSASAILVCEGRAIQQYGVKNTLSLVSERGQSLATSTFAWFTKPKQPTAPPTTEPASTLEKKQI